MADPRSDIPQDPGRPAPRMQAPPFAVLLGPDYAGKSSALSRLERLAPHWRYLSVDDDRLAPEHGLLSRLRRSVVKDIAPNPDAWSPDFLTTVLQSAAVHLRDELLRGDPRVPVVIDSYYYKLLAKCRLAGAPDNALLDWWRGFPRPDRVVYLDVPPEITWRRSRRGAALNLLEHYGPRPEWDGFRRYQHDLAKTLRDEIQDLPVTVIDAVEHPERTAEAIRKALTHDLG
ncbi:dTMP kinase [Streptomyces sp. NPDC091272]|uniref:dTMP kinase n=1 Tax=Streptomyces sp. NPDC091272 TaxID=3365981 RepID=UPI003803E9F4